MTDMACKELVDVVSPYLEGDLSERERRRFEAHLVDCPFCTDYVAQMRATIARLGAPDGAPLSPAARASVLSAFRSMTGDG